MDQKLSIIDISPVRKRISREIQMLINKNVCLADDIKIIKEIDTNFNNKTYYVIEFKNFKDDKNYEFVITDMYPFKPPKLYINNKSISFYHKIRNLEFAKDLKKYTAIECFCCETILCDDRWSPGLTFNDVIDDIKKYHDACRQVVIHVIVNIIKRKYLIDDINIIEWLY